MKLGCQAFEVIKKSPQYSITLNNLNIKKFKTITPNTRKGIYSNKLKLREGERGAEKRIKEREKKREEGNARGNGRKRIGKVRRKKENEGRQRRGTESSYQLRGIFNI